MKDARTPEPIEVPIVPVADTKPDDLQAELRRLQPSWQHSLVIGPGGRAAVASEAV